MEDFKLYSFTIDTWQEKIQAIFLSESPTWILVKNIFSDFILDGYGLIPKSHVKNRERDQNDVFIEKVLQASNKLPFTYENDLPLETNLLFEYLENNKIVVELDLKDEEIVYIGYIEKLTDKSFYLRPLSPKGTWLSESYLFRKDGIRMIKFATDYIESILAYNKLIDNIFYWTDNR